MKFVLFDCVKLMYFLLMLDVLIGVTMVSGSPDAAEEFAMGDIKA
jgi:5-bromo-4-chloroindolyl phosphate hydrolysis protein